MYGFWATDKSQPDYYAMKQPDLVNLLIFMGSFWRWGSLVTKYCSERDDEALRRNKVYLSKQLLRALVYNFILFLFILLASPTDNTLQ